MLLASITSTSAAVSCASASASTMARRWAAALGAICRPWPSWLAALPRISARTRSPSRRASDRRFRTITPQPSPRR